MIVPILGCEKVEPLTTFYVDVLGAKLRSSFSISPDQLDPCHRSFEMLGGLFHLTSFPGDQGTGKSVYIYIDTLQEVDELYARVKDHPDIEMPVPLQDQTWGMREFNFIDSGGNRICIGAQLHDVAPSYPLEEDGD